MNRSGKRTINVDFDHTITTTQDEYAFGSEEPNPEMIEWVRDRYYEGHTIIVWTARPWTEAHIVAARLTEWDVRYHGIRCDKGGSDIYVDDKGYLPETVLELGGLPESVKAAEWTPDTRLEDADAEAD